MAERWWALPRRTRMRLAMVLCCLAFCLAVLYDLPFGSDVRSTGESGGISRAAALAAGATDPLDSAVATAIPGRSGQVPFGDLLVVSTLALVLVGVGGALAVAWRDSRAARPPGWGDGDDPLWSVADLD